MKRIPYRGEPQLPEPDYPSVEPLSPEKFFYQRLILTAVVVILGGGSVFALTNGFARSDARPIILGVVLVLFLCMMLAMNWDASRIKSGRRKVESRSGYHPAADYLDQLHSQAHYTYTAPARSHWQYRSIPAPEAKDKMGCMGTFIPLIGILGIAVFISAVTFIFKLNKISSSLLVVLIGLVALVAYFVISERKFR